MILTEERAKLISNILIADENKDKGFLTMAPQDALREINAMGYDFTVEEFEEYGKILQSYAENGELDAEALEDVAGGVIGTVLAACGIALAAGIVVGGLDKLKIW